ncbi:MAG: FG-GAP repeat domain-containing protein, partial [Candidatus Thermochlorobacter sp.]
MTNLKTQGSVTLLLFLLLFLTVSASAQVSFAPIAGTSAGSGPYVIYVADVNLDGNPDFVTSNYASSDVSVRLGDGAGGFAPPTFPIPPEVSVGTNPIGIYVADVNSDFYPDILIANFNSSDISVLFGDGTGDFPSSTTIPLGFSIGPASVFVANVNPDIDTYPDILTANFDSDNVAVLFGDGLG